MAEGNERCLHNLRVYDIEKSVVGLCD
jgi:hypothetical protein